MSKATYTPSHLDARVLSVVAAQREPIGSFQIYGQLPDAKCSQIEESLAVLYAADLVKRIAGQVSDIRWIATEQGHTLNDALLSRGDRMKTAEEAVQNIADRLRGATGRDPLQVNVCNRQEPELPMRALLCIDEDELDDWWESLDVEQKADAFARFALHMYTDDCRVYVEPSIPVLGTIGETDPEAAPAAEAVQQ